MAAEKAYSDLYYTNDTYATVGGISLSEINKLEHEFFRMVDFDTYISDTDYAAYHDKMASFATAGVHHVLLKEETKQGPSPMKDDTTSAKSPQSLGK